MVENEKFQQLVLEHLAHITQEITEVKSDVSTLKSDVSILKSDVSTLLEFRTEAREQFAKINSTLERFSESIDFLKEKQMNTDEEMFRLKKKIS